MIMFKSQFLFASFTTVSVLVENRTLRYGNEVASETNAIKSCFLQHTRRLPRASPHLATPQSRRYIICLPTQGASPLTIKLRTGESYCGKHKKWSRKLLHKRS